MNNLEKYFKILNEIKEKEKELEELKKNLKIIGEKLIKESINQN